MTKKDNKKNFWLEEFESFYVEGEGSKRFLNGITTNNMNLEVPLCNHVGLIQKVF